MQLPSRRAAEQVDEQAFRQPCDVADAGDPLSVKLARSYSTHTPKSFDRQWMEERELPLRRDDEQPVRLCHPARDLREELRARDSDRDREPDALAHVALQPQGDLPRRSREPPHPPHVEERLVDREALDEWCRVLEHAIHGLARLRVRVHAR
jgi:hypothetical protein